MSYRPAMDLDAITARFFTLAAAGDTSGLAAMCAPGCRVKQNIGDEGGVDVLVGIVDGAAALGLTVSYSDIRRVVADHAVTEQHLVTIAKADGSTVSSDVCVVLRFDDAGLITRLDEYVDSAALAPAFA